MAQEQHEAGVSGEECEFGDEELGATAREWKIKADNGDAKAQLEYGLFGKGVDVDKALAVASE